MTNKPNNSQHLEQWEHPSCYGGFSPDGDYVIYSQHRDSHALDRSNYQRIFEDLITFSENLGCQENGIDGEGDESDMVYDFRASHWAVGWCETILICHNAPQELIDYADEIAAALSDYPVYDESHFSELEWNEVQSYWESLPIRDRVEYIRDGGGNIFAARHDWLSENADPTGSVFQSLCE